MALKATVFKLQLHIADLRRHYYDQHTLTLARHPSETNARMMARVLAFALHADPKLTFCKGLSTAEEPDLWLKDDSDQILHWIEVGQPDERRIRQSYRKAKQMSVYCYSGNSSRVWWGNIESSVQEYANLRVMRIDEAGLNQLADLTDRNMELFCNIDEDNLMLTVGEHNLNIAITALKGD